MVCHEGKKEGGIWVCRAERCPHRLEGGGCELGKVSLTCDNTTCKHNGQIAPGVYGCRSMDLHLNADGTCVYALIRGGEEA